MSHLITTAFPHLRIRRVVLDHNEISIDAFLTVHANDSEDNWLTEELFADYVKIYFIILHDEFAATSDVRMASYLSSPESRVDNILENYPRSALQAPPPQRWTGELAKNYIFKELSFSEAMNSFYESNITTSELDRNSGNLKDINFNVKITEGFNLNNILVHPNTSGLRLFAMTHLDVQSLISDFALNDDPGSIAEMLKLGGNLAVENLLVRNEETAVFDTPETYDILTYEDGTPYSGIYHVHTVNNPGPDGYVGYMEGPRSPMAPNARRLYSRSVPYRKVIANFILNQISLENTFNGSEELQEALDYNYSTPHTETRNMFSQLYSDTNLFASQLPIFPGGPTISSTSAVNTMRDTNLANIYQADSIQRLRKKHFDLLNERRDFSIFKDSYNYISYLEDNDINHTIVFRMDFEKLVRAKSKYAFIIDNLIKAYTNPNAPDSTVRQELYDILSLVKITKFKVVRYRLSNEARSNNPVCTNDFDLFSNANTEVEVVSTSEPAASNRLDFAESRDEDGDQLASIYEEPRVNAFNLRQFMLKDYNLAKKINYGNYAYRVEVHMEDGIKQRLFELAERMLRRQSRYMEFLSAAQGGTALPSNTQSRVDFERNYVRGNISYEKYYDHVNGRYSEAFKQLFTQEYATDVIGLITDFTRLEVLLGTISAESRSSLKKQLVKTISPLVKGDYETAEMFSVVVERSISSLLKILQRDTISDTSTSNFDSSGNSFRKSISRSPQNARSNTIIFEKAIPGTVKTFVEGDVFYSYGARALELQLNRASVLRPDTSPGSLGVFAESIDFHGQDIGVYRIMDIDTYLELPDTARNTVDTNIRQIETTLPSETINQADKDLTDLLDTVGGLIPSVTIEDPSVLLTTTNLPSGIPIDTDIQSGLPGIDNQGILRAGDISDIDIQAEAKATNLVNYGDNSVLKSVTKDIQNEILVANTMNTDNLLQGDELLKPDFRPNSGPAGFAGTEAEVKVLMPGLGSEANFATLTNDTLAAASSAGNGTITLKVEPSFNNGIATNNVITISANGSGDLSNGLSGLGGIGASNSPQAGANLPTFGAGNSTFRPGTVNNTSNTGTSTGGFYGDFL